MLWIKSAAAGCGDWQPRKPSVFSGVARVDLCRPHLRARAMDGNGVRHGMCPTKRELAIGPLPLGEAGRRPGEGVFRFGPFDESTLTPALCGNGHEVSGGSDQTPATGDLCLESEGVMLEFRQILLPKLP